MSVGKKIIIFLLFIVSVFALLIGPGLQTKKPQSAVNAAIDLPAPDGKPLFIMFFSQDCSICAQMEPDIARLEKKYGEKINFVYIDAENPESARVTASFNITGVPSFFWLTADRKLFDSKAGGWPIPIIKRSMESLLKSENGSSL